PHVQAIHAASVLDLEVGLEPDSRSRPAARSPIIEHASAPSTNTNPTHGMNRGATTVHACAPIVAPIAPPKYVIDEFIAIVAAASSGATATNLACCTAGNPALPRLHTN